MVRTLLVTITALGMATICLTGCGASRDAAASVNGHDIPMRAYDVAFYSDRVAAADSAGYDVCATKQLAAACSVIKQQALRLLIDRELIREYAADHNIAVSPAESTRQWAIVFKQRFHNRRDVLNAFVKRLHETEQDLKDGITNDLLQQKVLYSVTVGTPSHTPATKLAVIEALYKFLPTVKAQLKARKPFLVVATLIYQNKQSGCLNLRCGFLGWIPDVLVPSDRAALSHAASGTLVGPYKRQRFFELYEVQGHQKNYQMTPQQQYVVRQQRFTRWLSTRETAATVKRYVAV